MKYFYMPQGLDVLRQQRFGCRSEQFRRLSDQCQLYEREVLPTEHPLKSITYYGMAAANLSLMYLISGQEKYLAQACRWIFAGVNYPHWGKAIKVDVDLSAAWLLFGYGLSYNWLKDVLSPSDRQRLLEKLILQGERMYRYAVETGWDAQKPQQVIQNAQGNTVDVLTGRSWAVTFWQNHNWIDFAGLAMAGYAIMDEYPSAKCWTEAAKKNFLQVLSLLPEDGSDYEGVVYWRYGVIWLFHYAQILREREGIDLFQQSAFLKNTFFYRLYQLAPDKEQNFNHGDCHDRRSGHIPCLYYKIASEYRNGYAQTLAQQVLQHSLFREGYQSGVKPGILPEAFLEYLWYDPTVTPMPLEELTTIRYFPDLGLISARTGWGQDEVAFSYKCSPGGGHKQWNMAFDIRNETEIDPRSMGHHHPDANSFMLIRGGDFLAIDEGYSSCKMAQHHNLVLVDGKGFAGDGRYDVYAGTEEEYCGQVQDFVIHGNGFYLRGESSGFYPKDLELQQMQREILSCGTGWYLVLDTICSAKPHIYTWLLHGDQQPSFRNDHYRFENGSSAMEVWPGDLGLRFGSTVMMASANVTSQEPDNMVYTRLETLCEENKIPTDKLILLNLITIGSACECSAAMPKVTIKPTPYGWLISCGEDKIAVNLSGKSQQTPVGTLQNRYLVQPSGIKDPWEI